MNALPAIRFRAATPADASWLTGRLPPDRDRGATFVGGSVGAPVAAFVVAPPLERYEPEGLALAFSVERRSDARVIAGKIVELAREMATRANLGSLYAWPPPVEASSGDRAYRSLGFKPFDHIVTWEGDAEESAEKILVALERIRARSPHDACWRCDDVALGDSDAVVGTDAIIAFYEANLAQLGAARDSFTRRLRGQEPGGFDPVRSRVLVLDGVITAMILTVSEPGTIFIAARIVAPAFRRGALGMRLFASAHAASAIPTGCRVKFQTHDRHRGTAGLARRLGVVAIETRIKLRLD